MKKNLILTFGICLLTVACASSDNAGNNIMAKIKTCLTEQSWQVISDGTLYNNGITTTAKQISNTCLTSLSLTDAGIEPQTTQMATTLLNALASAKATAE